jgi:predicted nucleotidyltransferase component of viral defense system
MTTIAPAVKTTDDLLLWFLGYFAQKFRNRAIVKGGMVLRLLNSPRATNDLDILFVPFSSKKEILPELEQVLADVDEIESQVSADSKCIRCRVRYGKLQIQIEGTIAESCEYESVSTVSHGAPLLLAIQRRDIALAHKIGAWNERDLMRDLYDIHYFISVLGVKPDLLTLEERLRHVFSGRKNRSKAMTMSELIHKMELAHRNLDAKRLNEELGAILSKNERAGLDMKIKTGLYRLMEMLRGN